MKEINGATYQLQLPEFLDLYSQPLGPEVPHLVPPQHQRLILPGQKLETPVDLHGTVDIDALINLAKKSVEPRYQWRGNADLHHAQWVNHWYASPNLLNLDNLSITRTFVELPILKVLIPREMHKFIHDITWPSEIPSLDVMEERIMCWRAVSKLFRTIGEIASKQDLALRRKVFIEGNPDVIGNRTYDGVDVAAVYWYASEMKRHFSGAEFDLARLDKVPQEFRLLDPDMIRGILDSQPKDYNEAQAENVLRLTGRIKALGRVVRKGAQTIATVPETRLLAQVA